MPVNPDLNDPRPKDFEVPAFQAVGVNRVVNPGPRAIKKLQSSALPMRRLDDVRLKIFQREQSRARARHENPARFHEGNRE